MMQKSTSKVLQRQDAGKLLDLYYHDLRSHLLEAAAAFDRLQGAGIDLNTEPRLSRLRQAARLVTDAAPERARRFLEALSDE